LPARPCPRRSSLPGRRPPCPAPIPGTPPCPAPSPARSSPAGNPSRRVPPVGLLPSRLPSHPAKPAFEIGLSMDKPSGAPNPSVGRGAKKAQARIIRIESNRRRSVPAARESAERRPRNHRAADVCGEAEQRYAQGSGAGRGSWAEKTRIGCVSLTGELGKR
ncbi:hypothetical protein U9M48_031153, partial [Paspalum notatum var. saurae]